MQVILKHKAKDAWANVFKYKNCYDWIAPYFTRSGNRYTGLTEEEARTMEKKLGYPEGHLAQHSKFWITYTIKISDKEITLDTDNPFEELQYMFLRNHRRVANSLSSIKPSTDWVLVNKDAEAVEANNLNRIRRNALKEFDKMSLEEMRQCLRIYGHKSDTISAELVENKLMGIIESNPSKFFTKWINNKVKNTEFIIEAAIAKNIIRKSKNIYYYGTDIIGHSLEDTIAHLDAPTNQDLKLAILKEIESKQ